MTSLDAAKITPTLWIGSHPPVPGHVRAYECGFHKEGDYVDLAALGFDVLVLCAIEYQPTAKAFPGVEVVHAPFDDDANGLSDEQTKIMFHGARKTTRALEDGKKCLVTCWAGWNRSGITTALALAAVSGLSPQEAGEIVRQKREHSLNNMAFRAFLSRCKLKSPCELCEAKPITKRYHEDAICWVADCKTCKSPMVVYKVHGVMPPVQHISHMLDTLRLCGRPRIDGWSIDLERRSIPSHWHAHLRPTRS